MATIRSTPRTQDEILARIPEAAQRDPLLSTEAVDLITALDRTHLYECEHVDNERVDANPEAGTEPVTPQQAHDEAVRYMPFALEKAEGGRGISAWRSLNHYAAWLWLCLEDADWEQFADWEDYEDYGLAHLATARRLLGMEDPE